MSTVNDIGKLREQREQERRRRGRDAARARRESGEAARESRWLNPVRIIKMREYDHILFVTVLCLVGFGLVMVLSASQFSATQTEGGIFSFLIMQSIAAAAGFVALFVLANGMGPKDGGRAFLGYRFLAKMALPIYVIANLLLAATLVIGHEVSGGTRWIRIPGLGFQFQPSEIAKIAVILFLAHYIAGDRKRTDTVKGLLGCAIIIGIPCALVALGRNFSTVLIIAAIGAAMIFLASKFFWRWLGLAGAAAGGIAAYLAMSDGFRASRFAAWRDPWSDPLGYGYHAIQSLYAIASGGLFGLGIGNSNQKMRYLPEAHNDFIFAIIVEELGLFGAGLLLLFFGILVWRGCMIAIRARDLAGTLIAAGITAMISIQVIINVGVVTGTIPNTGIPLPFISYGGTSMLVMLAAMGILLNISKFPKNKYK